ncbi:unnamed protein product [Echinostoma caproni]|uniref:SAM domain-containing protein n=1 Tax=Echinostoma caproni TaxID=27848 RepID=A0A3P8KLJ5_9TREM|nr:unnamed protein product [Echinostoma caproni]
MSGLKSAGLSPVTLTGQLLELLPHLSLPAVPNFSCVPSRRISTSSAIDPTKDHDLLSTPKTSGFSGSHLQLSTNVEKNQSLKKQYLNLIAESITQGCDIFGFTSCEGPQSLSDCAVKELVMQHPLSQLLLRVFLHPGFTKEDRNWLCSLVRNQQQAISLESIGVRDDTPSTGLSDAQAVVAVQSKAFDCLLEALTDLSTILHSPSSNPIGSVHFAYPGPYGALEQRRLSDGPYILSQSLATSSLGNETRVTTSRSDSHGHTRNNCTGMDCVMNVNSYAKSLAVARASLPNALAAQYPVETITEHTSDSVSLSSASSNFSSNLDLRPVCHHRHGASPVKSPVGSAVAVSTHEDSYSLPPSPPSTVATVSSEMQITSINGTCSTRIPCNLSCANYPLLDRDFHNQGLYEPNECDGSQNPCTSNFGHGPDSTTFAGHDSSPEPQLFHKSSNLTEDLTGFSDSSSPMFAVPSWLKSLRLHKYAGLFQHLSYGEFMGITESWLEERNVTQGARTKLLLNIRKLATRGSLLQQMETDLLQAQSTGPASLCTLRACMTEIWNILHTPMAPCFSPPPTSSPSNSVSRHDSLVVSTEGKTTDVSAGQSKPSSEAFRVSQTPTDGVAQSLVSLEALQVDAHTVNSVHSAVETESLPNQIMSCLTKVCSRLLVSSQPDLDCCEQFIQLLDIIGGHPAFSDKQKSLTASWKQQMFNLLDSLPFHLTSDPSRSSRSIPRSYHGGRSFRKPPCRFHPRSKKGIVACCSSMSVHDAPTLATVANSDPPCTTSSYSTAQDQGLGACNLGLRAIQTQGHNTSGHSYHPVCSLDDNSHRRHSVPVNQIRLGLQPIKSCQGRRMPSPNPAFMPSRNTQFFFPGPPQASSSSDADVSQSTTIQQFPRTRFPSPSSAYESGYPSGCPRSLIPPATAPPTRMPSPSDVRQHGTGMPPQQDAAPSLLLAVPASPCQPSMTCPCASVRGIAQKVDEGARASCTKLPQQHPSRNLPFQPSLHSELQSQLPLFPRGSVLSESVSALDCLPITPGLSDLSQPSSLQTPTNSYLCTNSASHLTGNEFDSVRTATSLSCAPLASDRTAYQLFSHDHARINPSAVAGHEYGGSLRAPHANCPCGIVPHAADPLGANITGTASDGPPEWCATGTGQLFRFPSVYAAAGDPRTGASVMTTTATTSGTDTGTEFIEHNLDLLTRKVTELAIGGQCLSSWLDCIGASMFEV